MKKSSLLAASFLVTTFLVAPSSAYAAPCPAIINASQGECTLDIGGQSVVINPGVTVTSALNTVGIATNGAIIAGDITNHGTIDTNTNSGRSGIHVLNNAQAGAITNEEGGIIDSYLSGIYTQGNVHSITNHGSITAHGNDGIHVNGANVANNITNGADGYILTMGGDPTDSNGILVGGNGSVTGSVINQGRIEGYAGIRAGNAGGTGNINGAILNEGHINVGEYGIYTLASVIGSINNAENASITSANSHAIDLDGSTINTGIVNNGAINANTTTGVGIRLFKTKVLAGGITLGENSSITAGSGIEIVSGALPGEEAEVTGNLVNDGEIWAQGPSGNGIYFDAGTLNGNITNNAGGKITADGSVGTVAAIYLDNGSTVGNIENYGLLAGSGPSSSHGIFIDNNSTAGNILNALGGRIETTYHGIHVQDSAVGNVENRGRVETGDSGIEFSGTTTVNGAITNRGTILTTEYGIYITDNTTVADGVLNNGRIEATDDHGIRISSGATITSGGVVLDAGSTTKGTTGLSISDANVTGNIVIGASNASAVIPQGLLGTGGDGLRISSGSTINGNIINNGIIEATGSGIIIRDASRLNGNITNNASAKIKGGNYAVDIRAPATAITFDNYGELDGAIRIDDTTLNLENGTIATGTIGGAGGIVNINTNLATAAQYGVDDGTLAEVNIATGKVFTVLGGAHKTFDTAIFDNQGTLRVIGNPASSAVMTVTGNYDQSATGFFSFDAQTPTIHSALNITGVANFVANTGIHMNITGNEFDFSNAAIVKDVITAGTLGATTFTVTDSSYLYNFNAVVGANSVDLQSLKDATKSVQSAVTFKGNNPAQGASKALDQIIANSPGGDMNNVINALGSLGSAEAIADAASQTLPVLTGGSGTAVLQTMGTTGQIIQARQSQVSGLSSGDGIIGDNNVWVKPFGTWSDQGTDDGVTGYDADTYGVIGGVDGAVSDDLRLGVALTYANTDVDSHDSRNKMDVNSYHASMYGSYALDPSTEVNFQIGGGYSQADSKRIINFGGLDRVAKGDIDGYAFQTGVGVGHSIALADGTSLTPAMRLDYNLMHNSSYTEKDAGALNLDVDSQTTDQLIPSLSARLDHEFGQGFTFKANAGVGYDVLNDRNSITASFVGGGSSFVTNGIEPSPWVVHSGVGVSYDVADDLDVTLRYDREDRGEFDAQTASLRLQKKF